MTIEVALGYHDLETYRELHASVVALGPAVWDVVYRSDPPAWLLKMAQDVNQANAAVVVNVKGVAAAQVVAILPFSLYELLLNQVHP